MTTEDIVESQSVEDGGVGGPGAPMPLSALEVGFNIVEVYYVSSNAYSV